jgi:sarcosine oxidase
VSAPGRTYDVAVVGLGVIGSATAWQLTRRGLRVVGLEWHVLGHDRGASHGDSRIVRLSHRSPALVRAAALADAGWTELETATGEPLVTRTGGVDVFAEDGDDVSTFTTSLDVAGVPYELLDAAESRRRWPGLAVPDGAQVLFQPATGVVAADRATAALRRRALAHGAVLRGRAPVTGVREAGDGVELRIGDGTAYRARHVVVAAGAWTDDVLAMLDTDHAGREAAGAERDAAPWLRLRVTREHVVRFAVDPGSHVPGRFPTWSRRGVATYSGVPELGDATVAVFREGGGREVAPDGARQADPEYVADVTAFVRTAIPGAGPAVGVTPILSAATPDQAAVVGPVPGHERVTVALGDGHGFAFAPWFGRVLAELLTGDRTSSPISAYAPGRPAITRTGGTAGERSWSG